MNTKKADFDVDAYVKEVLGEGGRNAAEGSIDGELTTKAAVVEPFSFPANSWVEHGSSRLLLIFERNLEYLNLEVDLSGLGSKSYKFSIPKDFLRFKNWSADTANFSNLSFDQAAKKLSAKLEATMFRDTPAGHETGKLQANVNIFVV